MGRLLVRKRTEVDPLRVLRVCPEAGVTLVQLRTSRAEHEQRHSVRPVGQMLDKGEQGSVTPVQILEAQDGRPFGCQRLQVPPPGGKRLLLTSGFSAGPD